LNQQEQPISFFCTTGRYCDRYFSQGVRRSGIYAINVMGKQIEIYCEFQSDGHNWIVSSIHFLIELNKKNQVNLKPNRKEMARSNKLNVTMYRGIIPPMPKGMLEQFIHLSPSSYYTHWCFILSSLSVFEVIQEVFYNTGIKKL